MLCFNVLKSQYSKKQCNIGGLKPNMLLPYHGSSEAAVSSPASGTSQASESKRAASRKLQYDGYESSDQEYYEENEDSEEDKDSEDNEDMEESTKEVLKQKLNDVRESFPHQLRKNKFFKSDMQ